MHAYMIIAHNQFALLEKLVKALDDERNDIFIHIDAKVSNFDFDRFTKMTEYSTVAFTDKRFKIKWGSFDMIKAEYALFEKLFLSGKKYDYVHIISGCDLPIKSNDEIHTFFSENYGKEFIHFTSDKLNDTELDRVRAYHFFPGRRNLVKRVLTILESKTAKVLGINRIKNLEIQKGSQWASITGSFAEYVYSRKDFVYKQFKHTFIPDEFFIQTLFVNSPYSGNLFMPDCNNNHFACARLIDWERGNPYVWRIEDADIIKNSPCIFARKFDLSVDSEIVDEILANR